MNVNTIASQNHPDNVLANGNWELASYYELSSNSLFWNRAAIIKLSVTVTKIAEEALLYLLQKQANSLGIWEQNWSNEIPTIKDFLKFFTAEKGFNNIEGNIISPVIFWEKYNSIIKGLIEETDVVFTRDGNAISYFDLIQLNDLIRVICFDDEWNEQNYFIETKNEWMLFHWNEGG